VHGDRLSDDQAIDNELSDSLARVGIANFVDLVGIEPDLALSAADNRRREAFLSS
jgi:hypothetical protein